MSKVGDRPGVAFGPVMPGWGSWEWVGADISDELSKYFATTTFGDSEPPEGDAVFVVKHAGAVEAALRAAPHAAIIYCPVDYYDSARSIDADWAMLRRCARIVIHCERLRKYFLPYAAVEYMDHHVKFAAPLRKTYRKNGFVLWVGVRSNLPYLAAWLTKHPPEYELVILTNLEDPSRPPCPGDFGLPADGRVRIENWSAERQRELTSKARAALDIKGDDDFRQRHKSPAKTIDFLASGCPVATNPDSSVAEHLARMGFLAASPLEPDWWFSRDYWEETRRFGAAVRELFSLERIGRRYKRIIEDVLAERSR
jgi:hypothetical protein